jgi:repressor LexA
MLSAQQSRILQLIKDRTRTTGRSPSVRAIAAAIGVRSPASVQAHLKTLQRDGYLRLVSHRPRIFEVNFTGAWAASSADPRRPNDHDGHMADQLTPRQRRILEFIHEAVTDRGYPPSIREICDAVGLTSTSSVHSQLELLEEKGYIRRDPTKPRAVEVYVDRAATAVPRSLPTYAPLFSGAIAAGTGVLPDDQVEEVLPLPRELVGEGDLFVLRVRGESMIGAGILEDDYVVVRRQTGADDGDIVAALVPNQEDEATVKLWCRKDGHILLVPANPAYEPIDGDHASLLGKVVTVLRRL